MGCASRLYGRPLMPLLPELASVSRLTAAGGFAASAMHRLGQQQAMFLEHGWLWQWGECVHGCDREFSCLCSCQVVGSRPSCCPQPLLPVDHTTTARSVLKGLSWAVVSNCWMHPDEQANILKHLPQACLLHCPLLLMHDVDSTWTVCPVNNLSLCHRHSKPQDPYARHHRRRSTGRTHNVSASTQWCDPCTLLHITPSHNNLF
jgi:hypothetical protein